MEKIKVNVGVSHIGNEFLLCYEQLGLTAEKWAAMSEAEQQETLQEFVYDGVLEQPNWIVTYFSVD